MVDLHYQFFNELAPYKNPMRSSL